MKKTLSMITLAVLSVGLLGSCSKINERLDNLEKKVDGIENEQIASINTQITNINSSIADLGQIRSDITSLKQSAENHGQEIFDLQEADEAIKDRILNLEDYLDDVLPTFAEKDWVIATFSTLEQYEATCDTIAKIEAKLGTTSEKLSKDIKACADSLTKWVNKTFEGYYTAAQMDAKLTEMKAAIDSAKSAGGITDAKADSIATELTKAKAAVDTAKANIRKEYRAAIDTAIKTSEGKLTKALTDKIATVNTAITNLTTRVTNLEKALADLTGRVKALEEMIQSVTIVPAYSDGSVKVEDDTLFIDLSVTPKEAVATLGKDGVKILLNRVQTKAVVLDMVPTDSIKFFKTYKENGTVSIKAHIKKFLAELGEESLTVAVNVKKDKSDFTTGFVPVTVAAEYVEIGGVKWATKNLGAEKETDYGYYFAWGGTVAYAYSDSDSQWKSVKDGSVLSDGFSQANAPFYESSAYTKYTNSDSRTVLEPGDDAATALLGDGWRMPTTEEFKALYDACLNGSYDKTTNPSGASASVGKGVYWCASYDGVAGCLFCDGTNKLFFPAAGNGYGTSLKYAGSNGNYWSSSLYTDDTGRAYYLYFYSGGVTPQYSGSRYLGFPVRPVSD